MPTYEYKCKKCEKRFEVFQSITEDPLSECDTCDGTVQRLISNNINIQFLGSGFYINDKNNAGKSQKKESNKKS